MSDKRFNTIVAIYCLCADYHSGQRSRGYRILSRISSHYRPQNIPCSLEDLEKSDDWLESLELYRELETKYAHRL